MDMNHNDKKSLNEESINFYLKNSEANSLIDDQKSQQDSVSLKSTQSNNLGQLFRTSNKQLDTIISLDETEKIANYAGFIDFSNSSSFFNQSISDHQNFAYFKKESSNKKRRQSECQSSFQNTNQNCIKRIGTSSSIFQPSTQGIFYENKTFKHSIYNIPLVKERKFNEADSKKKFDDNNNIVLVKNMNKASLEKLNGKPIVSSLNEHLSNRPSFDFISSQCFNNGNFSSKSKRVVINIGGVKFETYKTTLRLIPESRLANLTETNSDYDPVKNEYFFDRDPSSFLAILNYYRTGRLHAPADVCGNLFYDELNFWGIGEHSIQPCCWTNYSTQRDCDEILKKVMDQIEDCDAGVDEDFNEQIDDQVPTYSPRTNKVGIVRMQRYNKRNWLYSYIKRVYSRLAPRVWTFLNNRKSSLAALIYFWISIVILTISIANFVLETSAYFRIPYEISTNKFLSRKEREALTVPHLALVRIELICNIFFSIEFILKFLSSPNKTKFVRNPYYIFEFLAILPIFVPADTIETKKTWHSKVHGYIEVFYILRILRIFTLVPKFSGLRVLLLTVRNSVGELVLYFIMLFMTIMIFASFVYYAEQIFESDDNKFDSILISLWWAIVTITTLGYGDIVPSTPFGYIIGGLCAITGLIFLALPVPVIVNNFTTFYMHAKAREKLKSYTQKGLPNRAVALHFQTTDGKFWLSGKIVSDERFVVTPSLIKEMKILDLEV